MRVVLEIDRPWPSPFQALDNWNIHILWKLFNRNFREAAGKETILICWGCFWTPKSVDFLPKPAPSQRLRYRRQIKTLNQRMTATYRLPIKSSILYLNVQLRISGRSPRKRGYGLHKSSTLLLKRDCRLTIGIRFEGKI